MDLKIIICIKYCGGCNPTYDRVEVAEKIRMKFSDTCEFVSHENKECGHVLIIAGCSTACVDLSPFKGKVVKIISNPEDVEKLTDLQG